MHRADLLVQSTDSHQPMRNYQHLRIGQILPQDVLDRLVCRVVEIGGGFIHDEERRLPQLQETPSER